MECFVVVASKWPKGCIRAWVSSQWIVIAMVLAATGITVHYSYFVYEQRKREECQTRYNIAFAGQILARAAIADEATRAQARADEAVDGFLFGFAQLVVSSQIEQTQEQKDTSRAEFFVLSSSYVEAREEARNAQLAVIKAREDHPLPPIPECASESSVSPTPAVSATTTP